MKAVYIRWIDSAGPDGWNHLSARNLHGAHIVHSIGFVLSEDDDAITLVPHVSCCVGRAESGNGILSIPRIALQERVALPDHDLKECS
jgi:hypothetical protein